ncbi:7502_t:CDS:2 [Ambispora gerdemannii]|uniref:7502_t:CDS:1 n=1 Tax=Ambispora gerdemannii TaxID=144530 RepID=A0A9N9G3V2_9GLOM|nr:7502_t:CDS:2 [Ambispora gerdemannii]
MYGSKYPAVKDLGIGATNAGKKVMVRGWLHDEEISVSLPNIFELEPPSYLDKSYEHFLVIDKPEYDLVLGSTWLTRLGNRIDGHDGRYWESNEEKRIYYARNNIDILSPSLYTFYELLFPKFTTINSNGEAILIEFSDQNMENTLIDLSKYYDSEYSETESESSNSEIEVVDVPSPVISGMIQDNSGASEHKMADTDDITVEFLVNGTNVIHTLTTSRGTTIDNLKTMIRNQLSPQFNNVPNINLRQAHPLMPRRLHRGATISTYLRPLAVEFYVFVYPPAQT